jgi:PAS domain S-box-containing protein
VQLLAADPLLLSRLPHCRRYCSVVDTPTRLPRDTKMSFKQLLRGGSPSDPQKSRMTPERVAPSEARTPGPGRSTGARNTSVLYVGEARETRLISGAFTYDHPQLAVDLSSDLHEASARLAEPGRYDALVIGWTVPESEAAAVISSLRAKESSIAIIAVGEHVLDVLREAGADQCVQKGNSLLSRLPIAIEEAVRHRSSGSSAPAPKPAATTAAPNAKAIRVAYAGDVDPLKAALGQDPPSLQITPLAQALRDCDVRAQGTPVPFDVIVIDHSASGRQTASTLSDVRARSLEVPVVLVLEPREERSAVQTFGSGGTGIDEFVAKTPEWQQRLSMKLETVCSRFQQQRELAGLRVKESRLRALVDKLPACVVRVSPEGLVLATNGVALSMFGAAQPNQLLRKPLDTLVAEEHRSSWKEFVVRVCAGEQRSCEVSITALDGVSRVLEAVAVPSPAETGANASALMVLRDISDRKRLELALEDAIRRAAPLELPEPQSATVAEPIHASALVPAAIAAAASEPVPDARVLRDLETDLHHLADRARTTFSELGTLLSDAAAQHDAVFTRQVEAYERVKAEQLEQWRSYEAFVQSAANGVLRVSLARALQSVNAAFASMLGYESPDALTQTVSSIESLVDPARWQYALDRWRHGSTTPVDSHWRRRDGSLAALRLHGRIVANTGGEGEHVEAIVEDVTALRGLEAQVRRARRWEDAARVTSGIAADLTHLVSSIQQAADRVLRDSPSDDGARDHAEALHQAVSKAVNLSKQLVAFGRKEARDPRTFDLNEAIRALESVLRRVIDEHIDLALNFSPTLGTVETSQPALEEAVVQFTVAAASALPAGGRIEIATIAHDVEAAPANGSDGPVPGRYARLSICASGWGLDADVQDRVAGVATTIVTGDVGKGLIAARRSIDRLGGHVSVDGIPGASLTFHLYVPCVHGTNEFESEEFAGEVDVMEPSLDAASGTERVEM